MTASAALEQQARALVAHFPSAQPLRAAAFIVTLYGDVVVPRGGSLWIGNVIEACAQVGISETLVRTAMSRLVAAGRLTGLREGRRSFYSLTPAAREEFAQAAGILYAGGRNVAPAEWTLVLAGGSEARPAVEALTRQGFGLAAPGVALRPDSLVPEWTDGDAPLVFHARLAEPTSTEALRRLAAAAWDLPALAEEYRAFTDLFGSVAAAAAGERLDGALALTVRLLLVHAYRRTALRDPQLPSVALPDAWSGHAARRVFAAAYRALSPAADAFVAERFVDGNGPLSPDAAVLERRLRNLTEESASEDKTITA